MTFEMEGTPHATQLRSRHFRSRSSIEQPYFRIISGDITPKVHGKCSGRGKLSSNIQFPIVNWILASTIH